MKINVGSTNPVKVEAVKEKILEYDFLKDAQVLGLETDSGVSLQPGSLEETIQGARNRAKNAFVNCDLGIGLESGLMSVPLTKTGYMDFCACAIFDGTEYYIGLSSVFEYPPKVMEMVLKDKVTITQAFHKLGLTTNPEIGMAEGAIGILTHNRLTRKDYTKQAITTALIFLETKFV